MLSIKEYADHAGISVQAVYRSLKRECNKNIVENHIIEKEGKKYIDGYGVKALDEARTKNPVVIQLESESKKIEDLEDQNEVLKAELLSLQKKMIEKLDTIQTLQNRLIETQDLETRLIDKESSISALNEQIEGLQTELEREKNKSFFERLFKR